MIQSKALATVACLAMGVAFGLHLGQSAIGEIDPFYLTPPPTRFHSDLVANRPNFETAPMQLTDASFIEGLGTGRIGRIDYPEEYYPIPEPAIEQAWVAAPEPEARTEATDVTGGGADAEPERSVEVVRYAHYAVTEEPVEEPASDEPATGPDVAPEESNELE